MVEENSRILLAGEHDSQVVSSAAVCGYLQCVERKEE